MRLRPSSNRPGGTTAITALLLLLNFFDDPVHNGIGGLQPDAMERTLQLIDRAAHTKRYPDILGHLSRATSRTELPTA